MFGRRICFALLFGAAIMGVSLNVGGDEPKSKKPTVEEIAKRWSPRLKAAKEFGQLGGTPEGAGVGAYSFRVVGPTFEEMWNHYADLCGIEHTFEEKTFRVTSQKGREGTYVVSDGGDGKGGRGLTVFLLKTNSYTATVSFHAVPDGNEIRGTLSVIIH